MIVSAPTYVEFLDPRVMFWRAVMLSGAIVAMVLVVFLTFKRRPLGIAYEWWRLSHGLLGVFIVVVALVHVLQVRWYVGENWQRFVWGGLTTAALLLLGQVRVIKPLMMKRRRYCIVDRRSEGIKTWTLVLEPLGHAGMSFKPGQFAWLTIGSTPFSMQQHPFSIASSAARHSYLEFTIRELGDFTSTIGNVKIGSSVFVEGPYGAFVPDLTSSRGLVLIAGGVGIAPMMSILRTLNDTNDQRPVILIYGNHNREETIFREELLALQKTLTLRITFVLENSDDILSSEPGRISESLLERHIPGDTRDTLEYFICGPAAMMDMVERYLDRVGVPSRLVHSERFDIA
jgi:predicted ferric reductase